MTMMNSQSLAEIKVDSSLGSVLAREVACIENRRLN